MGDDYERIDDSKGGDAGGGGGGNWDRRTTFSRLETLTRRFTFERSLTTQFGLDSEEAWTRKLIEDYVAVAEKGVEGNSSFIHHACFHFTELDKSNSQFNYYSHKATFQYQWHLHAKQCSGR